MLRPLLLVWARLQLVATVGFLIFAVVATIHADDKVDTATGMGLITCLLALGSAILYGLAYALKSDHGALDAAEPAAAEPVPMRRPAMRRPARSGFAQFYAREKAAADRERQAEFNDFYAREKAAADRERQAEFDDFYAREKAAADFDYE